MNFTPRFRIPDDPVVAAGAGASGDPAAAQRELKNVRYVVAAVDQDALKVWSDLWRELKDGVTPAGLVLPAMNEGFVPSCGWAKFLEEFWLLKHYLDYIHRFCTSAADQ